MPKRGRWRKGATKSHEVVIQSFSESSVPLASSSPQKSSEPLLSDEEYNEMIQERFQKLEEDVRSMFRGFLDKINPIILDTLFDSAMDIVLAEDPEDTEEKQDSNKENDKDDSVFKIPISVAKLKKKDTTASLPSTSKAVHWDSALNSSSGSNDHSDSDVFKTPPKRGGRGKKKESSLKTPNTSRREPFAVVTPGPMMNKSVRVLRMPQAGETAVSLSGSPLLVTPFGTNNSSQAALTLATDNGKVMTIVQPSETSPSSDPEMFSHLEEDAKNQIKEFATFLLKNMV